MKRLEIVSHMSVILACVLLSYVLLSQFVFHKATPDTSASFQRAVGKSIQLANVDWGKADKSLVLILSSHCGYCARSMPFYSRLANDRKARNRNVQLLAVMSEDSASAATYLSENGVLVDQVENAQLSSLEVDATPTVLLVDKHGKVVKEWVGYLDAKRQDQIISELNSTNL